MFKSVTTILEKTPFRTGMLEIKNDAWTDQDDGNSVLLTAEEFMERMTLESISLDKGSSTFWFNDAELFFGQLITLEHDGTDWTEASVQG